jgi:hypothetical protein
MARKQIQDLLVPPFPKKNISAAIAHYTGIVGDFQTGNWEGSLAKVGKLVESILKALYVHAGGTLPTGRRFKADTIINGLANEPPGVLDDSVRILIPRACRFIYDIASNRGGRHDPDEIDPNEMDASISVPICGWILAEMIRVSQKGAVDVDDAKSLVDSLTAKKYPHVEEIEGRVYFHFNNISARDVALLTLAHCHPRRAAKRDLIGAIRRHGFSASNAKKAIERISSLVDDNGEAQLRLLIPGLRKAEEIMKAGID